MRGAREDQVLDPGTQGFILMMLTILVDAREPMGLSARFPILLHELSKRETTSGPS
jgi:hypothetical protein